LRIQKTSDIRHQTSDIRHQTSFFLFFLFFLYHSPNDTLGGSGISRCLYQGFKLLFTNHGICRMNQRPALPALRYNAGFDKVVAIAFMAAVFAPGE
jgi:hypothetical protein